MEIKGCWRRYGKLNHIKECKHCINISKNINCTKYVNKNKRFYY